jgi:hypothetical protein
VPRGYVDNRALAQRLEIAALPFDNEKILYKLAWSDAPQFARPARASGKTATLTSRRWKIAGSGKG